MKEKQTRRIVSIDQEEKERLRMFSKKSQEQRKQNRIVWKPSLFKRAFLAFQEEKSRTENKKRERREEKQKE